MDSGMWRATGEGQGRAWCACTRRNGSVRAWNGCSHDAGCHPGYQAQPRVCVIVADRARLCAHQNPARGAKEETRKCRARGGQPRGTPQECRVGCQQQMSAAGALVSRCRPKLAARTSALTSALAYLSVKYLSVPSPITALVYISAVCLSTLPPSLRPLPFFALARESSRVSARPRRAIL